MNLIILFPDDFIGDNLARLQGRRLAHITDVQRVTVGDTLRVGLLDGGMGLAQVLSLSDESITLETVLDTPPPPPLPLTLVLALPRPKMLKRTLQTIATMGVKELVLVNSYRVEKSFWQTPLLEPDQLQQQLLLGLEQGRDTVLPRVTLERRFKPFVEDRLPELMAGKQALVAHSGDYPPCPTGVNQPICLVIGPEGGFIPYEVEKLQETRFQPVQLGPRILRVETAVPVLLAKLFS